MRPKHRNRRLATIAIAAIALTSGVAMLASALSSYRQYFHEPSAIVAADFVAQSEFIRTGGIVVPGSIVKSKGLSTDFTLRDFEDPGSATLAVTYIGILPDLFKEDSGAVVTGKVTNGAMFATEVLAKHDENYKPKLD